MLEIQRSWRTFRKPEVGSELGLGILNVLLIYISIKVHKSSRCQAVVIDGFAASIRPRCVFRPLALSQRAPGDSGKNR